MIDNEDKVMSADSVPAIGDAELDKSSKEAPAASSAGGTGIVESTKAWALVAKRFAYVELSSLVLMFASIAAWTRDSSELSYAISVAVISLAICLLIQTGEVVKPGILDKTEKPVSLFLLLWWAIGATVITFWGPFTITSNGYFSAWAGLIFTSKWVSSIVETPQRPDIKYGHKLLLGLGACGAVVLFATIEPIRSDFSVGRAAWGMVVGCITILTCAFLFWQYYDVKVFTMRVVALTLFCIWVTAVGVLTFGGPFEATGNGYFSSWAGFLVSTIFCLHEMGREDVVL